MNVRMLLNYEASQNLFPPSAFPYLTSTTLISISVVPLSSSGISSLSLSLTWNIIPPSLLDFSSVFFLKNDSDTPSDVGLYVNG